MYKEYLKRKEKVIISAIELLDERGIQGLTTKELAKREGITEPAIYKQFDSKQEIILAILDQFAKFDEVIMNTIIEQKMTPKEGILYFAESYASYYQNYPQITTVMFSMDVFRYDEKANQKMAETMKKRQEFMTQLITRARQLCGIEMEISPEELAEMLLAVIWSTTLKWKLDGCKLVLKQLVMKKIKWLIDKSLL